MGSKTSRSCKPVCCPPPSRCCRPTKYVCKPVCDPCCDPCYDPCYDPCCDPCPPKCCDPCRPPKCCDPCRPRCDPCYKPICKPSIPMCDSFLPPSLTVCTPTSYSCTTYNPLFGSFTSPCF